MVIAREGCRLKKKIFFLTTVYYMVLTIISRGRKNNEREGTTPQTVPLAWEEGTKFNVETELR